MLLITSEAKAKDSTADAVDSKAQEQVPQGEATGDAGAAMYTQYAQQGAKEGRAVSRPEGEATGDAGAAMYKQYAQQAAKEGRAVSGPGIEVESIHKFDSQHGKVKATKDVKAKMIAFLENASMEELDPGMSPYTHYAT